jgi:putative Holliday junction resolvase
MRYLAIDYGDKRIGLAYCDALEIAVRPLPPVHNKDLAYAISQISMAINLHKIESILVGIPLGEKNEETQQSTKVRFFTDHLKEISNLPIEFWNETYSTQNAVKSMLGSGTSKKNRSELVDSYSAMIILREFLNNKKIEKL